MCTYGHAGAPGDTFNTAYKAESMMLLLNAWHWFFFISVPSFYYQLTNLVWLWKAVRNFICTICLYLHAGSPSVTSLTVNNQTRTFTCISTGGPATTVTWTRDGAVITLNATHQQTKRIIDNSTSTYQTVLTIDPSVSQSVFAGLYRCTVENARGSSSRAVVVPGNGELMINK